MTNRAWNYQEDSVKFTCHLIGSKRMNPESHYTQAARKGRIILYFDPGLGKSRTAINILQELKCKKVLILTSKKNALNTWVRETVKWGLCKPLEIGLVVGDPVRKAGIFKQGHRIKIMVSLSAEKFEAQIEAWKPDAVIFDEFAIRNHKMTKQFSFLCRLSKRVPHFLILSGTLLRKGPMDLWPALHLTDARSFSSFWQFSERFCEYRDNGFGRQYLRPKNTKEFAKLMGGYIIRVRKEDANDRPKLVRELIPIDMTDEQRTLYKQLDQEMWAMIGNELIVTPNTISSIIKKRQLLICPKILSPSLGYGAGLEYISTYMEEEDPHVVVFTPYAKALPYVAEVLKRHSSEVFVLQGGTSPKTIREVEAKFNNEYGNNKSSCACTISFAESFELWSSTRCFFLGYEWTVDQNVQAESRLDRAITPHKVTSSYLQYAGTVDGQVLEILNDKEWKINITQEHYLDIAKRLEAENDPN